MAAKAVPVHQELLQQLPIMISEARRLRVQLVLAFAVIALVGLALGVVWPKKYSSSTTVLVQEDNIIRPLMEGRAVATGVADRARIAREVVYSRKVLAAIIAEGDWSKENLTPIQQEKLAEEIRGRTRVTSPGSNLIQIDYADSDATRAFHVARKLADLFIAESLEAKERESREAYEFIAARVDEYHRKLTTAEERLKEFRAGSLEARPGSGTDVNTRVAELRGRIETAQTELSELQMREHSLSEQLSGEAATSASESREDQYRARAAELQGELDRLLLSYTDEYPDVVRVRHQLADLQSEIVAENERRENGPAKGEDMVVTNPLYQQLRSELSRVRSDMSALRARVSETETLLQGELDRGRRVADSEAKLAELTRDYEVNRDIYQDLLRRRENARVSMSLDSEHRGLTFRIQEPAALPLQPSGLRFLHFSLAGLALGLLAPLGVVVQLLKFDPRVRSGLALAHELKVPLLVTVPRYETRLLRRRERWRTAGAAAIASIVVLAYGFVGWLKLGGSL